MQLEILRKHSAVIDGLNCAPVTRDQMLRTLEGGVTAINLTSIRPPHDFNTAMRDLARTLTAIDANRDIACIPLSVRDIEQAREDSKLAIILGAQNSVVVEEDVELLRILQRVGFRILQPTYMERNGFGCGVLAKGGDDGLTDKGRRWVELMNELRMLIDLSHVGYRTAADILALSKRPVIFSHSNARARCNSLRNIPDDLIRAAAGTGGTVGATLWPPMVRHEARPTIDDWAEQVVYMVNLVGIDHVAFGSDLSENKYKSEEEWQKSFGPRGIYPEVTAVLGPWFQFESRLTEGYESLAYTPRLADALQRRGFSQDAIDKVMGGNLLRVYREVWGE
ncbi:dipeptidase [Microvirga puerhi]|uniref:Dipeptidase n=1 Tax=Microvirga puerhi TaxID=2876078 RepID=A0ABS7VT31_9HYPH|nr:membrane dipeptidase [Microvirga puerhi]MBZ6078265.1 dipeptidase [Microvirga puerhi]